VTNNVLAVAELKAGRVAGVSKEVATAARTLADGLGGSATAVATGTPGTAAEAGVEVLAAHGTERVLVLESEALAPGCAGVHAAALADLAADEGYRAVVFPATGTGKDLAPRVAAKLKRPLLTDATALEAVDGEIVATRPVFAGKALAKVHPVGAPALVSIRPNVFAPGSFEGTASVEVVAVERAAGADGGYRVQGFEAAEGVALDVSEAAIVVSGGRGMKGPENWGLLEDLRDALGDTAALGASRAVVDAGWRPHAEQVGQTGKTVTPKLYFALGISGAIQHLAGMRTAGVVVAVNRDADAPIFGVADYGIVGDVFEVVPALVDAVRSLREE